MLTRYEERPTSKRGRMLWAAAAWVFVGPVLFGLALLLEWWSLIFIVPAVRATYDYIDKDGLFDSVDGIGRVGVYVVEAFRDDRKT